MKRLCLSLLTAALFAAASSSAQETVARYTFPAAGDYTNSATSAYATAASVVNSAGGTITSTGLHYFRNNSNNAIPESLEVALANNTYIGFTVTPGGNWPLSYQSLNFDFGMTNATSSVDPYTGNWAIFSSATGFTTPADLIATGSGNQAKSTGSGATWIVPAPAIDLSSVEVLQNAEGPVEFRLYMWDNATASTSNLILRFDNIVLNVANAPVAITTQPATQTVMESNNVTLTVAATGSAPFTYVWKKGDTVLADGGNISGATTASLTLTGVALADAGSYTVTVSNLTNSVVSDAATLTITPLPSSLPAAPVATAALLVSDIGFLANWNSVTDALTYLLDVSTDSNFGTFLPGYQARDVGNRLDYAVADLTPSTTYYYRVRSQNNVGTSATSSNTITVATTAPNLPPTITAIANQAIAVNRNTGALAFTVGDSTTPAADLVVTAASSNTALVPETAEALALGGSGASRTLTVTPAAGQTGTALISLTVSDGLRTTATSFTLTVNPGNPWPEITSVNSTTFTIGLANRFQVTATGTPAPTFTATGLPAWATLNSTTGLLSGTPPAGTAAATLTLTITATNGNAPTATQTFSLAVQAIPAIPAPMTVSTLAGTAGSAGSTDATGAAARFNFPLGLAVDAAGNAYLADESNHVIRKVTAAGVVTTVAGTAGSSGTADGTGAAARFNSPSAVALDAAGNLYVTDTLNHAIRKITAAGEVTTIAGTLGLPGSANGTGIAASFNAPQALALNPAGTNLYIADTGNHTVRRLVVATGVVTTLAGTAGAPGSVDGAGAAARFNSPTGIAADSANRVYVADAENNAIRVVSAAGTVTTLAGLPGTTGAADGTGTAARFNEPASLAIDAAGTNLYVLDSDNHTVRRLVIATGAVSTMAGLAGTPGSANGDGSAARFNFPAGIAVSAAGSAYIADTANHTIRLGLLPLAPTIQTQPQAVSVPMGNSAQLSVVASGRPAPTYQWRLNGIDIPGATNATYSIAAVRADQAGTYNVVVSNVLGNAVSTGATLTVTGPNQPATEGSTHGGGGAPSLWFFALLAGAAGARWIARRSARR